MVVIYSVSMEDVDPFVFEYKKPILRAIQRNDFTNILSYSNFIALLFLVKVMWSKPSNHVCQIVQESEGTFLATV